MTGIRWTVSLAWTTYLMLFLLHHLRIRWNTRLRGPENRVRRDRRSGPGTLLQFAGVMVCFGSRADPVRSVAFGAAGITLMLGALALTWYALGHLGRQWRIRAVVTEDHELIMTGPYRVVRHPIYAAFLAMLVGTALLVTPVWAAVLAVGLFVVGTEIRIRAEDAVLSRHFPETFPAYRRNVAAYVPGLR